VPWNNGPLALYHGCDDASATSIGSNGIGLGFCKTLTDFGQGFYTTTNLIQAKNWANVRCRLLAVGKSSRPIATVIRFDVDRDKLVTLDMLCFVTENTSPDFWDLIQACRQNQPPGQHRRLSGVNYDVVFGPVTLWPQRLVIKDCDQISFHTQRALQTLPQFVVDAQQSAHQPLFP
jgi:hypothetical protein